MQAPLYSKFFFYIIKRQSSYTKLDTDSVVESEALVVVPFANTEQKISRDTYENETNTKDKKLKIAEIFVSTGWLSKTSGIYIYLKIIKYVPVGRNSGLVNVVQGFKTIFRNKQQWCTGPAI